MDLFSILISKRLRSAREKASATQDALAAALGLKDRQSVSAIEVGERTITPEELVKAAKFLGQPLEYFTDPYLVTEQNAFSFRARKMDGPALDQFRQSAERLISAQRRFRAHLKETPSPVHSQLQDLTKSTPVWEAAVKGEQLAAAWELGTIPSRRLRDVAEEKLNISIFYIDAPVAVSGAACRLDDGDVILINREESEGRRNFDLGHEIFHLLSWMVMPPELFELAAENLVGKRNKTEMLADAFASGLLMPSAEIKSRWASESSSELVSWLTHHAAEVGVSTMALYWRLVNLGLISKDEHPFPRCKAPAAREIPNLYNRAFVQRLHDVLDRGHLTAIRATEVIDCSLTELVQLFHSYEMEPPFPH
ncbi:MAG: helix-turn-helix family protein [Verrucomicrobiales bacterium]|nr:helix-turn-helix family protein [Verrucomicrobiales bacterium]